MKPYRQTNGFLTAALALTASAVILGSSSNAGAADAPRASKTGGTMAPIPEAPGGRRGPPVCGGSDNWQDKNAPAQINSKDIVFFQVESSFTTFAEPPDFSFIHAFVIPLENKKVLAGLYVRAAPWRRVRPERNRPQKGQAEQEGDYIRAAVVPSAVFDELQKVVEEYKFIKENGRHHYTHGLPENFGGSITVKYQTGERIFFEDNQSPILTPKAGEAIVNALRGYLDSPQKTKVLSSEELTELLKSVEDKYPAWRAQHFAKIYQREEGKK